MDKKLLTLVITIFSICNAYGEILIDQTVAIVGKQILTLRDARIDHWVDSALKNKKIVKSADVSNEDLEKTIQTSVRRMLINDYLRDVGLLNEIPKDRLKKLKDTFEKAFSTSQEMQSILAQLELTESDLNHLLQSRIRSELFMDQHLAFRANVTEKEIRDYYELEKHRRFLGKPFENVANIVKADLQRDRIKKEFDKWLEAQTRRLEVILLPLPQQGNSSMK